MYVKRAITRIIKEGAKQVPVIAIIGPRQSGKSTLAKNVFSNHTYLDMQDADLFDFASRDPKGFLNNYKNEYGLIIDEAQYVPNLFSQIKVEADKDPKSGYFVLSGSQNFLLHEKISESLAGRVYFYRLLPFSIQELKDSDLLINDTYDQILKGFYPKVYKPHVNYEEYYQGYISTYVERDFREIRNIENFLTFQKFIKSCALRIGTNLNYADLATTCGISQKTVKNWLSLLETSFIAFLLPSYHENLGKRITKSPKLYFYDVGLASGLIGIDRQMLIKKREVYGSLFENMIVVDIIKNFNTYNIRKWLTFFRDSNKNEVDLIIECLGITVPIEVKATQTILTKFFNIPLWFKEKVEGQKPTIVYGGLESQTRTLVNIVSWTNITKLVESIVNKKYK